MRATTSFRCPVPPRSRLNACDFVCGAFRARLLFADLGGPLNPEFFRAPRKEMGEIQGERYECLFRRAAFALLRVCFVALLLSSLGFPTNAAAPKRSVHARGHAFQELLAAREQAFQEFVAALWPLAEQRGVSRTTFDRAFAGVSFDPKVVAMTEAQPEFVLPIWDYVAAAVSVVRVERGRKKADAESVWLAKAKRPMASTSRSSWASGGSRRISAASSDQTMSFRRSRRSPMSTFAETISVTNCCRPWSSCRKATLLPP